MDGIPSTAGAAPFAQACWVSAVSVPLPPFHGEWIYGLKVTVIGLGLVGTVSAVGLALAGHDVLATDIDTLRVRALRAGRYGGCEPGLADRLKSALKGGNIRFRHCDDVDEDLGEVALIAVGTPPSESHAPELDQVQAAVRWMRERSN